MFFGPGDGPIHYDHVNCLGSEKSIADCRHHVPDERCSHLNDVGVICVPKGESYQSVAINCISGKKVMTLFWSILCLTSRTTVTSARIPDENACHRARNLCVISRVQKGTPGLTHKGCVLQRVYLGRSVTSRSFSG